MPFNNYIRSNNYRFYHPYNSVKMVQTLKKKYDKEGIVVAFTFDYTVFDKDNVGGDYSSLIGLLKKLSSLEKVTLKVIETKDMNKEFVKGYLETYSIKAEISSDFLDYDILLDVKAGLRDAFEQLMETYDLIVGVSRLKERNASNAKSTISQRPASTRKVFHGSIYDEEDEQTHKMNYDFDQIDDGYLKQLDKFRARTGLADTETGWAPQQQQQTTGSYLTIEKQQSSNV